ncbi:MAG: vitamin B12 dependent-methionine synthase activation domain-containing protein [Planctomycetota bacterium]
MSPTFTLDSIKVPPTSRAILTKQGIPAQAPIPERIERLFDGGVERYTALAEPRGLYAEISIADFAATYVGEGRNERETPLEAIYPRAEVLALFAVTLGAAISREISRLFVENEPALAYMLDAIASDRADQAAKLTARLFLDSLVKQGAVTPLSTVLPYSPGYCGWHVSGQKRLFAFLKPEQIGITINASCLMQPLKSVSGVLVVGPEEIHDFEDAFEFCLICTTHQCRDRIASLAPRVAPDRSQGAP